MENLVLILIVGAIVQLLVLYLIIQSATKSASLDKHQCAQVRLLMSIAEKQGVPKEEIDAIIKEVYKF